MGKKKKLDKAEHEVARLAARLEKAEAKAERWKAEAKRLDAESRNRAAQPKRLPRQAEAVPAGADQPDATWNVTRLRTAARERGVPGYSRKSKDDLLRALAE